MSQLFVDNIKGRTGGALGAPSGVNATGVVTATSFTGSGDNLTFTSISASTGTFTGNVSIGGTLTYEDVTNIDSVGIITAQSGIKFGASGVGGTITATGQAEFAGVCTASSFVGDGTGLTGVASTDNIITSTASTFANINSTGIISATSFEGNFILDSYLFN